MFQIESHKTRSGGNWDDYRCLRMPLRVFIFHSFFWVSFLFRGEIGIYNCFERQRSLNDGGIRKTLRLDTWKPTLVCTFITNHHSLFHLQATEVIHPPKTQLEASAQILRTIITASTVTAISFNPSPRRHLCSIRRRRRPNSHIIY